MSSTLFLKKLLYRYLLGHTATCLRPYILLGMDIITVGSSEQ